MLKINKNQIKNIIKGTDSKNNKGRANNDLYSSYAIELQNYNDFMVDESEYTMGNWIEHVDRWFHTRSNQNRNTYGRGTIVMIDLGATNFGSEPSYLHPAVVVAENTYFVLIVPASTKKYGKGFSDIIDATASDGFKYNTGVQAKSYRWVSKSRIEAIMGNASSHLLDQIDASMLKDIPTHKKLIHQKESVIKDLQAQNTELNNNVADLEKKINELKSQLTAAAPNDNI